MMGLADIINLILLMITLLPFEEQPPMELDLGLCSKTIQKLSDFDPARLDGVWYDIKRYKNTINKGKCGTATYTWHPDNQSYTLPYEILNDNTRHIVLAPEDVAHGVFKTNVNGFSTPFDYQLIAADYDNFHIVYTCVDLLPPLISSPSVNIYSRKPTLDAIHMAEAIAVLERNHLDLTVLRDVVQDPQTCGRS